MARTLDKTKDYGTVCGGDGTIAFEQGGYYFDIHGDEVVDEQGEQDGEAALTPAQKRAQTLAAKKAAEEAAAPPADTTGNPELDAQITANLQG